VSDHAKLVQLQGGHHRIPESELDKHLHFAEKRMPLPQIATSFAESAPAIS
jgi:hypothetical protein